MRLDPIERTPPDVDAPDTVVSDEEGAAAARAVVNLFGRWRLTDAEARTLLGGISQATYTRWKRGEIGRLGVDLKTRLSILMGIHKNLRILYTDNERAYAWVKKSNSDFDGRRPLDIMMQGRMTDLLDVRHYLDAARGW